jgi:hypothetical protein
MSQAISGTSTAKDDLMATLGYVGRRMIPGPKSCIGIIQGHAGDGKTTFFLDAEDTLILNLDLSSTPGDTVPKAAFWPGLNDDGRPVKPCKSGDPNDGTEMTFSYEEVRNIVGTLEQLAEKGAEGRPKMVVIDTLDVLQSLVMDYLLRNQQRLRLTNDEKPDFYAIGQRGWTVMADEVVKLIKRLRNAGYGVWIIMQIAERWKNDGVKDIMVDDRLVAPSIIKPLRTMSEMIFTLSKRQYKRTVKKGGKPALETGYERILSTEQVSLGAEGKSRRSLPEEIVLPSENCFSFFEDLYLKSINKELS